MILGYYGSKSANNVNPINPVNFNEVGENGYPESMRFGSIFDRSEQYYNSVEAATQRQFDSEQASASRSFSSAEAAKDRAWQEYMSNTSISRLVADAEKAGINPLTAITGSGASTPTGSTAQSSLARSGSSARSSGGNSFFDFFGKLISSAVSVGLRDRSAVLSKFNDQLYSNANESAKNARYIVYSRHY